ncbi:MAG: LamG domain-containing protein [Verrucomicrobiota bacterium]
MTHNLKFSQRSFYTFLAGILWLGSLNLASASLILLHNWDFDSNFNDSVGGKNATAFGDAAITGTSKVGSGAVSFDGGDDYLLAGTTSDFVIGTGGMSVSFWFNVADSDKAGSDRILGTGAGSNSEDGWVFFQTTSPNDQVSAGMGDGGGRTIQKSNANGTVDPFDGQWHFVVGVFDPSTDTVSNYLDGTLESTISTEVLLGGATGAVANTHPLTFGGFPGFPTVFDMQGLLDDVSIWDGLITQTDVNTLYNGGVGIAATSAATPPTAIPEPSSILFTGGLLLFCGLFLIRKRKASAVSESEESVTTS